WDSDLSKSARSTVTFMRNPACLNTYNPGAGAVHCGPPDVNIGNCRALVDSTSNKVGTNFRTGRNRHRPPFGASASAGVLSLLKLAFQGLDFGRKGVIGSYK